MSESRHLRLQEGSRRFFGAIAASLSHEMNNVLATINELGGLLQDLVAAAEQGRELDPARLRRALDRIPVQIKRGEGYVRQLNRFAHSVDHGRIRLDLRDAVEEVVGLCERFARLAKVRLESSLPGAAVLLEASPFELRHVVYRCIDLVLAGAASGSAIQVSLESTADGALLVTAGESGLEVTQEQELASRAGLLSLVVESVGGTSELTVEAGRPLRVEVNLPSEGP